MGALGKRPEATRRVGRLPLFSAAPAAYLSTATYESKHTSSPVLAHSQPLTYNATLVGRDDFSDTLAIFRVAPDAGPDDESVPSFVAGQYAVLGLNNEAEPAKGRVKRAYSIASPPGEKRWLEFYIRYVNQPSSDNPLTHLLWRLKEGDRIWLGSKIVGKFTLADTVGSDDPRFRVFVAAGTGVAPFVSILKQLSEGASSTGVSLDNVVLLQGASHPHDIGYQRDLELVLNRVRQRYYPTISRPHLHPHWSGDTGRVETFFDAEKLEDLEERLGREKGFLAPENSIIYICGFQGTIAETLIRLFKRGFVPNDRRLRHALKVPDHLLPTLFFEQYDTEPILDLSNQAFLDSLAELFPVGI